MHNPRFNLKECYVYFNYKHYVTDLQSFFPLAVTATCDERIFCSAKRSACRRRILHQTSLTKASGWGDRTVYSENWANPLTQTELTLAPLIHWLACFEVYDTPPTVIRLTFQTQFASSLSSTSSLTFIAHSSFPLFLPFSFAWIILFFLFPLSLLFF
jgi:hypothetical protein